jgi:hypothetical protein
MTLLLAPFFYVGYLISSALIIGTVIVLYVSFYVGVCLLTAFAMAIRAAFRSSWPRDPRRPSITNRRKPGYDALGRPIQAHWSDRR